MAVSIIGPKFYAWGRDGKPLAFGKLYTYQARTNVPKDTYQSEVQVVENPNPVILNGEGYANVYLSGSYKMVLKDADENEIWSSDPVSANEVSEWKNCLSTTYLSPTSLKVAGNFVDTYAPGGRVRIDNNTAEYSYSTILTSVFSASETTLTISDPVITTGVQEICVSVVSQESLPDRNPANVESLKALNLPEGSSVSTKGYYSSGDGGGVGYLIKTAAQASSDGDVIDGYGNHTLSNGNVAIIQKPWSPDVKMYGAKGDGVAIDTAPIQATANASLDFTVSEPSSFYLVTGTITLRGGQWVQGYSKLGGGTINEPKKSIYGEMTVNGTPLFQLGDGADGDVRKMTFNSLRAHCHNGSVIRTRYSTENTFTSCSFDSRFYHCIDSENSYLCSFYGCTIGSSGTVDNNLTDPTYCFKGMDNSNGWTFDTCRMSGGGSGGIADIGRSYTIAFRSCVIESSKYGIHLGKNPDPALSGECNAITIDTCQFESCLNSIDAGSVFSVNGLTINNYLTTNPSTDVILGASIILGRVRELVLDGANFDIADNAYPFLFKYDSVAAGQGSLAHLTNSTIRNVFYKGVTPGFGFTTSGFTNTDQYSRLAENNLQLLDTDTGKTNEYVTTEILCSAGTLPAYQQISNIKPLGSQLTKVEIIGATGALDGAIVIGFSGDDDEYFLLADVSAVTLSDGYADISSFIRSRFMRATQAARIRHKNGTTGSSFRVKVTYKS